MALARALIKRPKVLLLDEPLGALDKKLREQMQLELRDLQRSVGITFVFVTHDQEEALTMSDRIAVMSAGKVLEAGAPADLYERPSTRFVAEFLGTMNFFDGVVKGATAMCAPSRRNGWEQSRRPTKRHRETASASRWPCGRKTFRIGDAGNAGAKHKRAARSAMGLSGRPNSSLRQRKG